MADTMAARGDETDLPTSLSSGALDAMPAGVAILDPGGTIVAVNAAWSRFADENGGRDPGHFVGWNYLSQCDRVPSASPDKAVALAAGRGLRSVLSAEAGDFTQEYSCHAPDRWRWMRLGARAIADRNHHFAAIAHEDITERVLAERARNERKGAPSSSQEDRTHLGITVQRGAADCPSFSCEPRHCMMAHARHHWDDRGRGP